MPMELPIEFLVRGERNDPAAALQNHVARKIAAAVRRFEHRLRHIKVRLVDVNGPRRGVDTRCSVSATLVDGGQLYVEADAAWPFAAITTAASRLGEVLRRDAGRHQSRRERAVNHPPLPA